MVHILGINTHDDDDNNNNSNKYMNIKHSKWYICIGMNSVNSEKWALSIVHRTDAETQQHWWSGSSLVIVQIIEWFWKRIPCHSVALSGSRSHRLPLILYNWSLSSFFVFWLSISLGALMGCRFGIQFLVEFTTKSNENHERKNDTQIFVDRAIGRMFECVHSVESAAAWSVEFDSNADKVACDELNELRLPPAELLTFDRLTFDRLVWRWLFDSTTTTCVGEMAVGFNGIVVVDVDGVADGVVVMINDGVVSRFWLFWLKSSKNIFIFCTMKSATLNPDNSFNFNVERDRYSSDSANLFTSSSTSSRTRKCLYAGDRMRCWMSHSLSSASTMYRINSGCKLVRRSFSTKPSARFAL